MAAVTGNNAKPVAADNSVNREKTCPLLLRVFYNGAIHNPLVEYQRGRTPQNELQVSSSHVFSEFLVNVVVRSV